MRQDFSNVTDEQLAQLFPILLEEHNPEWKEYFLKEKDHLQSIFGDKMVRINHIGSSAVDGLIAKPTVDILIEVEVDTDIQSITETMLEAGYVVNTPESDIIMYIKGYTPNGFCGQAVHIHVRHSGDWGELYFRDYLNTHPEVAAEYVELKILLKEQYQHDRDGYTQAKGEFVQKYTDIARKEYGVRYQP
ncbi:GrpB family protein [Paenibacillus lutimineralis]|uniref:GrpB family protein n=1 Tax=Paenibacillus lutimineralis TaxID=2707005 RepID=A0A3S9V6F1_9BACL|nr:GrpB family protein [Paenibacillus lutimineralis]AZS18136.1 GrpB family protein [Paenibacillus lutimineralis]